MLTVLRGVAGGIVAKILLGLLIIAFAVWGISGSMFGGVGSSTVEFGNTRVGLAEYRLAYNTQIMAMSRQFGQRMTAEQARLFGIQQSVLSQVVAGAVMDENARAMGLGVSDARLVDVIAKDTSFQDSTGTFSRNQLQLVLRSAGINEEQFILNRKAVSVRQQFSDAVGKASEPSAAFLDAYARFEGQKRVFEYVVVDEAAAGTPPQPSAAEIEKFYEATKANYIAPEFRKFALVRLTADDIAKPDEVSAEDVAKDYEARKASFTSPERRRVERLAFADKVAADAAAAKIAAGASFDEIVVEQGKTAADADLGLVTRAEIPDAKVAEAAFGLTEGATSGVVESVFGPVILRVAKIEASAIKPLAEVEAELRKELALHAAADSLFDLHDRIEDERAGGANLEEAARKVGLTARIVDQADASGKAPDGSAVADLPVAQQLLQQVFQSDVGVEADPVNIGTTGFAWFEVLAITPDRQKPLAEVREQVTQNWVTSEIVKRIAEIARTMRERVEKGEAFAAVAAELLPQKDGVAASTQKTAELARRETGGALGRQAVAAGFGVGPGAVIVAPVDTGDAQLVVRVDNVVDSSASQTDAELKKNIGDSIGDDLLSALVSDMQSRGELRINQRAIELAIGQ